MAASHPKPSLKVAFLLCLLGLSVLAILPAGAEIDEATPPTETPTASAPSPTPTEFPQPTPTPAPTTSSSPKLGVIQIMPDGSIEGTNKIQRTGNTYTLTDDIYCDIPETSGLPYPGLMVMRDGAVIDGAGHTIEGNGLGVGISLMGVRDVIVNNIEIKHFSSGISSLFVALEAPLEISSRTSSSNKIINSHIDVGPEDQYSSPFFYSSGYGIYLGHDIDTLIDGCTIKTQDPTRGIHIAIDCKDTTISNNKLIDCGLDLTTLKNVNLSNNTINGKPLVFLNGQTNQTVTDAEQVFLYQCSQVTVQNVHPTKMYGRDILFDETVNSVVDGCSGDIVIIRSKNNLVQNNLPHCIYLIESDQNKICSNAFSCSGQAIQVKASNNNDIFGNLIVDSKNSLEVQNLASVGKRPSAIVFQGSDMGTSKNNNVYQNILVNHGIGIHGEYFYQNNIYSNVIQDCDMAIRISDSNNNIYQNNFTNNIEAISLCGCNNAIYHNNFLNNTDEVSIIDEYYLTTNMIFSHSTNNTFDLGRFSGGNYWSTFDGVDNNGDGISETAYNISDRAIDNYPLMTPYPFTLPNQLIPTKSTPTPQPPTPTNTQTPPSTDFTPSWAVPVGVVAAVLAMLLAAVVWRQSHHGNRRTDHLRGVGQYWRYNH
jgi:nitrous oxidase accessory protein NosD